MKDGDVGAAGIGRRQPPFVITQDHGALVAEASTRTRASGRHGASRAQTSVKRPLTLIVDWFLNRDFDVRRDFEGTTGVWRSISGFDLIILTLTVALVLFHYWRFQDNSEAQANI